MRYSPFILTILFLVLHSPSAAAAEEWVINSFTSDLDLQATGQLQVRETIQVNFSNEKHGIFRDVPLAYQVGQNQHFTTVEITSVIRNGTPEPYRQEQNRRNLRLKIGSEDITLTGNHTYVISYLVTGVIRSFEGYDELYWNVTGNGWEVPIQEASATITLPQPGIQQISCYAGLPGSQTTCSKSSHTATTAIFQASGLEATAGLTVAAGFTPGLVPVLSVDPPRTLRDILPDPRAWVTFLLITAVSVSVLFRYWWKNGRDPIPSVIAEYEPPANLKPAAAGLLLHEQLTTTALTATIIDLANRGHLYLLDTTKKGLFQKPAITLTRRETTHPLLPYEKSFLNVIFGQRSSVTNKDLARIKPSQIASIKKQVHEHLASQGLFVADPASVRRRFAWAGLAVIGINAALGSLLYPSFLIWSLPVAAFIIGLLAALATTGLALIIGAPAMPQRTTYGRITLHKLLGYRLFINTTEKYRQKFIDDRNLFADLIPYAVLFGLTEKLSKSLAAMGVEPTAPAWYSGSQPFHAALLANTLTHTTAVLSSSLTAASTHSGSTGSGSVGGGFGGGGGGSW